MENLVQEKEAEYDRACRTVSKHCSDLGTYATRESMASLAQHSNDSEIQVNDYSQGPKLNVCVWGIKTIIA